MSEMEGGVRTLEKEMQELAKQSVIQDGKINVTLARKKKRVDRDLDNMLVRINDHRSLVQDIERDMNATEDESVEKEEELKFIEGQLVTTMIQQQRNLMKILGTCKVGDEDEYEQGRSQKSGVRFALTSEGLGDGDGDEESDGGEHGGAGAGSQDHHRGGSGIGSMGYEAERTPIKSAGSTMRSGIATVGTSDGGYGATGELEQKSPEDDRLPNYPSMEDGAPEGPGGESNDGSDGLPGGEVRVHRARSGIMQ